MEEIDGAVSVRRACEMYDVSQTELKKAVGKHRALMRGEDVDEDTWPPPLPAKRKGARGLSISLADLHEWWRRWPDA